MLGRKSREGCDGERRKKKKEGGEGGRESMQCRRRRGELRRGLKKGDANKKK